jgi:tRNA A-37 threonylcarbamoyl transferase component Bud32
MPQTPDHDSERSRPETEDTDSTDSLLVEAARALDPSTPPASSPGHVGVRRSEPGVLPLAAGTLVAGRYRLEYLLGEGGMGEVWAATHAITRRRVAMKFLKASTSLRPDLRQRFLREARAASLVQHPSIVEVLDVFELDGGVPVMVMDLLVGETLGAKLARDKVLSASEAASILVAVVEAVHAAHAIGIVHRDLKPDNIFLKTTTGSGFTVKVLDFGIAKLTAKEGDAAETGTLTGTGSIVGTPWYMAPEQCYGEKDIDQRADVWALGVILYECLSGQRPIEGSNVGQIVKRILHDGIVPIEERVPGLAPELARLVGRMLSPAREDRPRDLVEVHQVLSGLAATSAPERLPLKGAPEAAPSGSGGARASGIDPGAAPVRWDTGGPHAVPSPRAPRPFGVSPIRAATLAAVILGGVGFAVIRPGWHRANDASVTSAPAPSIGELVAIGATPGGAIATAAAGVATPVAVPTEPSITVVPAPPAHGGNPVGARPRDPSAPKRAVAIADTGGAADKDGPLPSAGMPSAGMPPARRNADGGLFEGVPF